MFQAQFSRKQTKKLDSMGADLSTNRIGVLQRSLALLEVVLREIKRGNDISIVDKNGHIIKDVTGIY